MAKTTRIPFYYHFASESDWSGDDVESAADGRLLDDRSKIEVEFSYPLHKSVRRTLTNAPGFTRVDFALAVAHEYEKIYEEEDTSRTTSPEPQGILLNRSRTDGIHGIWGHVLSDIVLEAAWRDDEDIWHLAVGS